MSDVWLSAQIRVVKKGGKNVVALCRSVFKSMLQQMCPSSQDVATKNKGEKRFVKTTPFLLEKSCLAFCGRWKRRGR